MIEFTQGSHTYYIYIITNKYRSTFYIGVANKLNVRLQKHQENILLKKKTCAAKYNLQYLMHYEEFSWIQLAIAREKEIRGWRREKKFHFIRESNENFQFLNHLFSNQQ